MPTPINIALEGVLKITIMTQNCCNMGDTAQCLILKVNNSREHAHSFYEVWEVNLFLFPHTGAIWIDKMCQINCWIIIFYWLNFIITRCEHTFGLCHMGWDFFFLLLLDKFFAHDFLSQLPQLSLISFLPFADSSQMTLLPLLNPMALCAGI